MKCAIPNCERPVQGELSLCEWHERGWRKEAGEIAARAEAGDLEALKEARSIVMNHVRLAARAVFEPLRESLQGFQPRQPQPANEGGLAEAMKETQ